MTFLPKRDLLTLEELDRICAAFIRLGTNKIRITGGEPLVRRDVMTLFRSLGARLGARRAEGAGGHHQRHAAREAGGRAVRRRASGGSTSRSTRSIPEKFASITRWGKIGATLDGIFAAKAAGLAIKINAVAMKGVNEDEFDGMLAWCGDHGFDLCLIETMPMGDITGDRTEQYLPLSIVRSRLRRRWTLEDTDYRTGGPARYFNVAETGRRIGFITPMTHNFCESCNRVRLTCTGHAVHVPGSGRRGRSAPVLRDGATDAELDDAIREAISRKPKGHDFIIDRRHDRPAVARHMSVTGG